VKRTTVSERGLVVAPRGRDAAIAVEMLRQAGVESSPCSTLEHLIEDLNAGAAFAVVTEEAIATADLQALSAWIGDQEEWSDLPFILITNRGGGLERNPAAARHLELLGNVTFLERPFHPTTLISLARSSLRARQRQYEARARLIAMRESELRYRTLFEAMDEGFCVIEFIDGPEGPLSDYIHVEANTAYQTHAGIPDIIGKRLREIVSASEAEAWADIYRKVLVNGEPIQFERELVETGRHLELSAFRVDTVDRQQVAVLFKDVSERRRAEAAVRESEARFRNMADRAPVMMWVTDSAGYCTHLNSRWYEFTGQAVGAGEAYGWLEAIHPDDRRIAEEAFASANAEQRDYQVDFRLRRADGIYRWVIDAAAARFADDGEYLGYVGSVIDIDERREAEKRIQDNEERLRELNDTLERRVAERTVELSESQRRFRGIFDSALQFMALLTPEGTVVEVNETALSWSDIAPDDIVGKPFWAAAPMRENLALQNAIRAGILRAAAGEIVRAEHEMRGPGDVRAIIDFSLKPVTNEHGEPVWLVAEGRDITELKMAQEALRQSQKMEAMGQLTGGVAHDFNNLLTPIIGSLDRLQRKVVGDERDARLIDGAMQSAERARTLVQRLLAFARRQPLQTTAVNVSSLIEGMADLIASTLGPRIKLTMAIAEDLPSASADENQLEMAILNLAVNARDAMNMGGTLSIGADLAQVPAGTLADVPAGQYIRVSVADTGTGMDQTTLARAVEPFFSTKGIGQGTGLGLSMVHGLAAQLGGGLVIESAVDRGTRIDLYVPVSAEVAQKREEPLATSQGPQWGTILLVDDEVLIRMSTAELLTDLGYEVIEAGSAEEAIRVVAEGQSFDFLVTDHLMPGLSGLQLADEIRKSRPHLPVLIISGYADIEGIDPGVPRLVKPFRLSELAAKLDGFRGNSMATLPLC
jgi:PAS domain S-box-containing protein